MLKKLIAIDFGKRRIGLASGQMITKTATPLETVQANNGEPDWKALDKVIKLWKPTDIVIGLPIDAHDQETEMTKDTRLFAESIKQRYNCPIHLINEAFSTREARWRLDAATKKNNRHLKVDGMAACIILETWMNNN